MGKSIIDKQIPIAKIKLFRVTGLLYNSKKRFRLDFNSFEQAMQINLWRGSVWAIMEQGNWKLLKKVYN